MKKTLVSLGFLLLISCGSSNTFENQLFQCNDLQGYQIDSLENGSPVTRHDNQPQKEENSTQYLIFKKEKALRNNYLRINGTNLDKNSIEAYLKATLDKLPNQLPPFVVQHPIQDTILNNQPGFFYSILISYNEIEIEHYHFVVENKTKSYTEFISNIVKNQAYEQTQKDFDAILKEMTFK